MPARSFCGSGSSNHITPRSPRRLATSSAVGSVKISLPSTISSTVVGQARPELGERGEVGAPLRTDADLDHRHAAIEQRAQQLVVPGRRALLEEHARRVDRHPVAGPAEQRRHRAAGLLAGEVPQRDLDRAARLGRDGRVAEPAAGEQAHPLGEPLHRVDLLADDERGQRLVDHRGEHAGERAAVAVARLAVADEPGVGVDAHEAVRQRVALERERRRERGDGGDDHRHDRSARPARRRPASAGGWSARPGRAPRPGARRPARGARRRRRWCSARRARRRARRRGRRAPCGPAPPRSAAAPGCRAGATAARGRRGRRGRRPCRPPASRCGRPCRPPRPRRSSPSPARRRRWRIVGSIAASLAIPTARRAASRMSTPSLAFGASQPSPTATPARCIAMWLAHRRHALAVVEVGPRARGDRRAGAAQQLDLLVVEPHRVGQQQVRAEDAEAVEVDDRAHAGAGQVGRGIVARRRDVHRHVRAAASGRGRRRR